MTLIPTMRRLAMDLYKDGWARRSDDLECFISEYEKLQNARNRLEIERDALKAELEAMKENIQKEVRAKLVETFDSLRGVSASLGLESWRTE